VGEAHSDTLAQEQRRQIGFVEVVDGCGQGEKESKQIDGRTKDRVMANNQHIFSQTLLQHFDAYLSR
jgi:hypothetical protein